MLLLRDESVVIAALKQLYYLGISCDSELDWLLLVWKQDRRWSPQQYTRHALWSLSLVLHQTAQLQSRMENKLASPPFCYWSPHAHARKFGHNSQQHRTSAHAAYNRLHGCADCLIDFAKNLKALIVCVQCFITGKFFKHMDESAWDIFCCTTGIERCHAANRQYNSTKNARNIKGIGNSHCIREVVKFHLQEGGKLMGPLTKATIRMYNFDSTYQRKQRDSSRRRGSGEGM